MRKPGKYFILLLLIIVSGVSCDHKKEENVWTDENYFKSISGNDIELGEPLPNDWRASYPEPHQTFEDYKKTNPQKAVRDSSIIYLQPIGEFRNREILLSTKEYLQIFFQLSVRILEPLDEKSIPDSARRTGMNGKEQFYTGYIMDHLLKGKNSSTGLCTNGTYRKRSVSFSVMELCFRHCILC